MNNFEYQISIFYNQYIDKNINEEKLIITYVIYLLIIGNGIKIDFIETYVNVITEVD